MYILIVGAGRVGLNLALFLVADGNDVTLIESNDNLCNEAVHELDTLVICGSRRDKKILEESNISEADVFVAATGNDEANLLACILVKEYNINKIIVRVSDPAHEDVFKKVGINSVVSPELTAAGYLEKLIIKPKVADLIVIGKGSAELLDITVTNNKMFGKLTSDVSPTKDHIISAIHEKGDIIPDDSSILEEGCKISVLVKRHAGKQVTEMFTA